MNLNIKYAVVAVVALLVILAAGDVGGIRSKLSGWWNPPAINEETPEGNTETPTEETPEKNSPTPVKLNEAEESFSDQVGGKPAPKTMSVKLSWEIDAKANPEFSMYKIYRDADGDFSSGAVPIVEIALKERRTHIDLGLSLKPYYYKVVVIDKSGARADSNIIVAQP